VVDATELGDLLPLCGAEYTVGAETIAQTGEKQAQPTDPKPHCVQSFTYTFACERRPAGESHVIPRPGKYEHYRLAQPYSLRIEVHGGEIYGEESGWLQYSLYEQLPGTKGGLWSYRRLVEKQDLTMFNWPGNDYRDRSILDCPALDAARALQDAKRVSLGFLHWLQTEQRAPELKLRPDVMGTADWPCETPLYPRIAAHPGEEDDCRAGGFCYTTSQGRLPRVLRLGRRRLVPDRHPPLGLPMTSARAAARSLSRSRSGRSCRSRRQPDSPAQRISAPRTSQRLLPPAPGGVERRRGAGALAAFALEERVLPAAVRERSLRALPAPPAGRGHSDRVACGVIMNNAKEHAMTPEQILAIKPKILTQKQREAYFNDGFLFVPKAIGEEWIAKLRAATDELVERAARSPSPIRSSISSPRTVRTRRDCAGCRTRWSSTRFSGTTAAIR
jgi:hypothetical protein